MDEADVRISWAPVLAVGIATLAFVLSIFALGRALASGNPAQAPEGAAAAATTDAGVETTGHGSAPLEATLSEFAVELSANEAAAGPMLVRNTGAVPHFLEIEGTDLRTSDLQAGAEETLDLSTLEPGTYTVLCDVPGHRSAGMETTLTIVDGGHQMAAEDPASSTATATNASLDPAAMTAEMERLMEESIGSFPAETQGEGAAPLEPTILDDGTKLFELTVDELQWEVEPGKVVDAVGYNGMVPGPTMNVDVGDRVTIRVINELDHEGTSLHPHGLKDHEFALDGVTFISQDPIAPGDSMDYTFVADEESVMTYHSHHMSLHQVPNGLFGAMIVGDYAELAGIDGVVDEQVMILNDAGNIGLTLNGKSFPATKPYSYKSGDKVVVHYANEGQMNHPMHLHNQDGTVIAKDGYLLDSPYQGDTFDIAPGERLTVVYEMGEPGTWVWHCHILSHVKRTDGAMTGMLTAVIVEE